MKTDVEESPSPSRARATLSFCFGILVLTSILIALSWRQWRSEAAIRQNSQLSASQTGDVDSSFFFSQGWKEEEMAFQVREAAETETSSGLPEESALHLQRAQEFYRLAVLNRPLCVDCSYRLARVTALLKFSGSTDSTDSKDPVDLFRRTLALAPNWADRWKETGLFFLDFWSDLSEADRRFALTCLEKSLTLAPGYTAEILSATFSVDPSLPAALSGANLRRGLAIARWYQQQGDTERATRLAQEAAVRLQEEASGVRGQEASRLLLLGEVQIFLDNEEAAREAYEEGLKRAPDPAARKEFCWRLAAWHFGNKDFIAARDYYFRYLELEPDNAEAVLQLGLSSVRAGNREEGIRWLERALRMQRTEDSWQARIARVFEEAGRYDRANKLYRHLLARAEQPRPDLLLRLAQNYKHLGLGKEALAAYRQVLSVDTSNAEARAFIEMVEGKKHRTE